MKLIILVGLPGSGKSTFGKSLSNQLNLPFLDLDQVIEENAGKSISRIFLDEGEDAFRKMEKDALDDVIKKTSQVVVSTGGGTPCFFDNMDSINQYGISVYLDVNIEEIARRIAENQDRPLMQGEDPIVRLRELHEKRKSFYQQAEITISDWSKPLEQISLELADQLKDKT